MYLGEKTTRPEASLSKETSTEVKSKLVALDKRDEERRMTDLKNSLE